MHGGVGGGRIAAAQTAAAAVVVGVDGNTSSSNLFRSQSCCVRSSLGHPHDAVGQWAPYS